MSYAKREQLSFLGHELEGLQREINYAAEDSVPKITKKITGCYKEMKKLTDCPVHKYAYPAIVEGTTLYHRLRCLTAASLCLELNSQSVTMWSDGKAKYLVHIESKRMLTIAELDATWRFLDGATAMYNY